jgi:hypothetical protein
MEENGHISAQKPPSALLILWLQTLADSEGAPS